MPDLDFPDLGAAFGAFDGLGFDFPDLFDFSQPSGAFEDTAYRRPKAPRRRCVKYEYAVQFAESLDLEPGVAYFAFVSGRFIFGDLIEALFDAGKMSVRKMTIQTLSISQDNIDSLRNVVDGSATESLHLILSDYWYAYNRAEMVPYLFEQLDVTDDFRCAFASVHTKIASIETWRGNKVVFHGSANLRSSDNIEQVCIECDDELYDFVEGFANRILDEFDVVNADRKRGAAKSLRSKKIWQQVAK